LIFEKIFHLWLFTWGSLFFPALRQSQLGLNLDLTSNLKTRRVRFPELGNLDQSGSVDRRGDAAQGHQASVLVALASPLPKTFGKRKLKQLWEVTISKKRKSNLAPMVTDTHAVSAPRGTCVVIH